MSEPEAVISLPFGDKPELEMTGSALVVALVPTGPGEQPYLELSDVLADAYRPVITREGDVVRVRFESLQGFPFKVWELGPRVQMTAHVPASVKARVHLDAGRVRVRGLSGGEVDVQMAAGVISLKDVTGRIRLRAGAGKITGEHLAGTIDVETNAGAVNLVVDKLASGRHRVHSSMGAVRLVIAPGQKVSVEAKATMGSARSTYPSSPGAEAILDAQTELGSVVVVEGGRGAEDSVDEDPFQILQGWMSRSFGHRRGRGRGPTSWGNGWQQSWWQPGWPPAPPPPPPPRSPEPPSSAAASDDELKRVLTMVQEGKLTPEEAQKILRAMER